MKAIHSFLMLLAMLTILGAQDARTIVDKANSQLRGKSSYSEVRMEVVKPDWSRSFQMKIWSLEPDYALVLITAPARDKGTVTLKRKNEVWNWIPNVQRVIKIPPSMMMQPWMGSNFTNDDLVRQSSIVEDYRHTVAGEDTLLGRACYIIRMIPKPQAGVVWGKIRSWISKDRYLELKADYYDEDGNLIRTMKGSKIKTMDQRIIPTHWEMIPHDKPGEKTIFEYKELRFNIDIAPSFFSVQNMKRVR